MLEERCGICGEDFNGEKLFEKGGKYYRGFPVRTYSQGQMIDVAIHITSNHKGYFQFKICKTDNLSTDATQKCLNQNVLIDDSGRSKIPVVIGFTGLFNTKIKLPKNLICKKCVFQVNFN